MLLLLHNVGIRLWYHSWPKLENFVDISAEKVAKKSVPVRIPPCFRLIFDQKWTDFGEIFNLWQNYLDRKDSSRSGDPLAAISVHLKLDLVAKSNCFWTEFNSPPDIFENFVDKMADLMEKIQSKLTSDGCFHFYTSWGFI